MLFYAYSKGGDDPQEIILHLDDAESAKVQDCWDVLIDESLVVQASDGSKWEIKRADCGMSCKCALVAERVK